MTRKLFSLEEIEELADQSNMETSPEVGEISNALVDEEEDSREVEDMAEGIEEGIDAADQLEDVKEVIEKASEEGGMDPVAAEAVRIAIESICTRINANPKAIYSVYATENFESASSKQANTQIALEGITEFIKDVWEKIKRAISKLWDKVVALWDKHVSVAGTSVKATEAMLEKVRNASIKSDADDIEVGSYLAKAFATDEITANVVSSVLTANESLLVGTDIQKKVDDLLTVLEKTTVKNIQVPSDRKIQFIPTTKTTYLVGGKYLTVRLEIDDGDIYLEELTKEINDIPVEAIIKVPAKGDLVDALKTTLKQVNKVVSLKDTVKKYEKDIKKSVDAIDKVIKKVEKDDELKAKKLTKVVHSLARVVPGLFSTKYKYTMKTNKAVLTYASSVLRNAT
jgi:hypothetical protein